AFGGGDGEGAAAGDEQVDVEGPPGGVEAARDPTDAGDAGRVGQREGPVGAAVGDVGLERGAPTGDEGADAGEVGGAERGLVRQAGGGDERLPGVDGVEEGLAVEGVGQDRAQGRVVA